MKFWWDQLIGVVLGQPERVARAQERRRERRQEPRPRGVMANRIDSCGCVWENGEVVEECSFHAGRTP